MYERVLVPTDGSEGSTHAAMRAIDLADRYGATVHVFHVANSDSPSLVGGNSHVEPTDRALRAVERIETMAGTHGVDTVREIHAGDPAEEILEYAAEIDADLVVAGTHGRSGIERRLIGSVAERLVRHADCPVMTVQLPESDVTVEDADHAEELAENALAESGYDAEIVGSRRQRHLWVVEAEGDAEDLLVYVDPVSQRTSVVRRGD